MDAQALLEVFRRGCLAVGLAGLSMVFLVACGIWLCRQARRLHTSCQGQPVFRSLALLALVVLAFTVGGTKTNGVNNLPPQQRTLPQLQPMVLPWLNSPRLLGSPPTAGLAPIASWTRTGAYSNEFVIDFPEGWCFPYETNHLESVALVARGEVFPSEQAEDPLASLTTLLSIKPGTSEVVHGPTTNNSYRIEWHDGSRSRMFFDPTDAAIELFRNGDIEITEDGVTTRIPRTLPFAHDGYGQDAEWVAANFTNATEILSVGYPQWVDAQVGTDLTNGLYKLTVSVSDNPPEATQISVGDLSVTVTNAGEYVFLLEKGIEYPLGASYFGFETSYSTVDDLVCNSIDLETSEGMSGPGKWSLDGGWSLLEEPSETATGRVLVMPTLRGSPDMLRAEPDDFPVVLTALLSDCARPDEVEYEWMSQDGAWDIATPAAGTTTAAPRTIPSYATGSLSVNARMRGRTLTSSLVGVSYGTNAFPSVGLDIRYPSVTFLNDDYRGDRVYPLDITVHSDVPTGGVVTVRHTGNDDHLIYTNAALTGYLKNFNMTFGAHGLTKCASNRFYVISRHVGGGCFSANCRLADGGTLSTNVAYNVIEPLCRLVTNEEGPDGRYVNPSRLVYGTNAWLSVSVNGNFSPNDVRWMITPQTGRITERRGYMVKVESIASSGTVVVEARFNSDPHQPRFEMPIVQRRTIPVRAFVVKAPNVKSQIPNSRVVGMVEYANRIYEQVGIRFNLLSISRDAGTTNDWVLAEYDVDPMTGATNRNHVSAQAVALMNTYTNHDCIELYFVGKITNSKAAAFKSVRGIAVSQLATQHVVAHEIGHALGLSDCYNYSEVNSHTTKDFSKIDISGACFASRMRDWGSALGRGFYAKSDKYALVQPSFLMYGRDGQTSVDIPDGAVLSISNKAMSVSSAYHVPVGASAIKQNNSEIYSQ